MIHANLVDNGVFFGVAALTLLLVMFLYAVITAHPEEAARTEAPLAQSPVLAPPPLPAGGEQAFAPPAFPAETGRPAGTDYAARHGAPASVTSLPVVSSGSQRRPAAALLFLIAGLALAVIGAAMFFGAKQDVTVCANQALAICLDGFVVLHPAQLLGGALAIGGIGLISTAVVLALR
jgi:hypothetical protein